jgi:DNA repair exonuclease SbcCD ATPase subunit
MAKLSDNLQLYRTLSEIFSPTGAQAYVLDNVIDLFNQKVSEYVSMIWPNASYELLAYKETKKSIKAKLSDRIVIAGREVSIGSLSNGELRCLCLSIDFAISEMMEHMTGSQINPYILDEPFEGLDAANRERAVTMLEHMATRRQIWIIDHNSEAKAMFSDIVRIEKSNGVSSIARSD